MRNFSEDNPTYHYPADCINVKDKVVLDLGCGNIGALSILEYPSTPEYLLNHGAKRVIGVELNQDDVAYLRSKIPADKGMFLDAAQSMDDIAKLIKEHNIQAIKCDNEGGEGELFALDKETFRLVDEYYIETHNSGLHQGALDKFIECGYEIREELVFEPLGGLIRVLFAYRV